MRPPPVFTSLHGYRRSWATADLVAGVTLLVIAVPEQLATSRLAGMPPITGFYAFIAGTVMFALLGSNPQMSVGGDSTIAPLFAVGVAGLAASGSSRYIELVAILAVMVGLMVMLVSILRLGWIADFLSTPIVTGFLSGVAVIIIAHQLPDFLGLSPTTGSNEHRIAYSFSHLGSANGWTVAIGVGVLVVCGVCERIDRRIPGTLFALVGSVALVSGLGLQSHGVAVLGNIHAGAPHFGLTGLSWSTLDKLAPLAAVVALVVITQTAATTRAFSEQGGYDIDAGRDFLGVGAGSVVAGLVGSFAVDASPPRTGAVASAGGRTQAGLLGAALAVVLLIPVAGVLKNVPLATLAGILIFIAVKLFKWRDLLAIAHFDAIEFALTAVTLLAVVLIGIEQGIAVAVGLAILDRIRLTARPDLHELGRIPGTTSWSPLEASPDATQVPGVLVVLFASPLWYANAVHFREMVEGALEQAGGPIRLLVVDTIGMSDLDYTGTSALGRLVDHCAREHIEFGISRSGEHVQRSLRRSGLLDRIGEDHLFPSVDEAVTALAPGASPPG
ncbi:MAG TPA: SulP family inorganic anion transporter [Acidimicrobiales bacterium]|nr:SulP family inorganic anion transporter [Acidimicrobiales bacterium]